MDSELNLEQAIYLVSRRVVHWPLRNFRRPPGHLAIMGRVSPGTSLASIVAACKTSPVGNCDRQSQKMTNT